MLRTPLPLLTGKIFPVYGTTHFYITTTTHHPPPTKNICFKRVKRRGRYKIFDWTKTNNESEVRKTKVGTPGWRVSRIGQRRGMVVGGRRRGGLVCEMSWPTSRLTGWVKRCEVDVCSKFTHRWTSSIFIMSTSSAKSKLYTLFLTFFVAFSHSTYTCLLGVLASELAQMLWHAWDTYTVCTHNWISSIFIMSTPFAKSKLYTLFLAFLWHFRTQRTLAYWVC